MEDTTVAAVQMHCKLGDKKANLEKISNYVQEASKEDVDIICFPELSVSGYVLDKTVYGLAEKILGPSVNELFMIAKKFDTILLAGLAESGTNNVVYNTMVVVGPKGLIGKYRKIHVPITEVPYYRQGYEIPVFRTPKSVIGITTCYDWHFPELAKILSLKGAEVLFFPHASPCKPVGMDRTMRESREEKRRRWLKLLPARAIDNGVFVVINNHVGEHRYVGESEPWFFAGVSFILDPNGDVIAESKGDEEEMIMAELDAGKFMEIRRDPHFYLKLRRPEVYQDIVRLE